MKKHISVILSVVLSLCFAFGTVSVLGETYQYTTWKQSDSRWGSISFGSVGDTMSSSGCAVTSIAILMVHTGAASTDPTVFNPGIFVNWLKNNGGFTSQGWLYWNAVNGYTSKFSYYTKVKFTSGMSKADKIDEISYYINKGYVAVAEVSNGGHYVAVDRVSNGVAYIFDPANTGYDDLFDYSASGVLSIQLYKGPKTSISGDGETTQPNMTPGKMGIGTYLITSDDGLNIRSGAGASYSKLGAIPYNTSIYVSDVSSNNWGYITYDGVSGWITLEYTKMTAWEYIELKVTPPSKTQYKSGETLDTSGMTVTAVYSNNTTKTITSGYTISGFTDTVGTHAVTVAYNGRGATFNVTITESDLSNTTFYTGTYKIISDNGVNVRSEANTGSTILTTIPYNTEFVVTKVSGAWGYTTVSGVTGWIYLEYSEMVSPAYTGLQVTPPTKTTYTAGEQLNTSGMVVTAVYSDNSKSTVSSGYTVSGFNSTVGTHTITVTYNGKTATFTVTVNASTTPTYQLGTYRVLSEDGMNVRSTASTSGTILKAIPYNTQFVVTKISNGWGYTTVLGVTGWIYLEYSELISPAENFTVEIEIIKTCFLTNNTIPSTAFKVYKVENGTKTQTTNYTLSSYDITTAGQKNITVKVGTKTAIMTVTYYAEVPKGDADFDGAVSTNDALLVLCFTVGKITESEIYMSGADINKDGLINTNDALWMLQCVVGKV